MLALYDCGRFNLRAVVFFHVRRERREGGIEEEERGRGKGKGERKRGGRGGGGGLGSSKYVKAKPLIY